MRKKNTVDPNEYLSPLDLATYELARARLQIAKLSAEILEYRANQERRDSMDRLAALKNEHLARMGDLARISKDIEAIQQDLGVRYSVDMATMAYDDVTGKITRGA